MTEIGNNYNIHIKNNASSKKEEAKKALPKNEETTPETNLNQNPSVVTGKSLVRHTGLNKYAGYSREKLEEEVKTLGKTLNVDDCYINDILRFDEDYKIACALEILNKGVRASAVSKACKEIDKQQAKEAILRTDKLIEQGLKPDWVYSEFLTVDDKRFNDVQRLFDNSSANFMNIRDLERLPEGEYEAALNLIDNFDVSISGGTYAFLGKTPEQIKGINEKFTEQMEAGHTPNAALSIAKLYDADNEEAYNTALELLEKGYDITSATGLAKLDPEARAKAMKTAEDFNVPVAIETLDIIKYEKEENHPYVLAFTKLGCKGYEIIGLLSDYDGKPGPKKALRNLETLLNDENRRYTREAAKKFAALNDEELKLALKYFEKCPDVELAIKYAQDEEISKKERENLEKLLDSGHFYGAKEAVKSPNVEEILKTAEKDNEKIKEILDNDPNFSYEDLSARDKFYLRAYGFNNEFYAPEEYVHKFLELKNMTTPEGYHIFNTEHFQKKMDEDFAEMKTSLNDAFLYNNLVKTLWMNPNSEDYKYFEDFVKLIQTGKISPSALRNLESATVMDEENKVQKLGGFALSNNLKKDIDLIRANESKEELLNAYIPEFEKLNEAVQSRETGEAFKLKNEDYIRIKTDENASVPIKLKKETYARLFPPASRFSSAQQIMGDCYCIETLMSTYCNEKTRANLLQAFEEDKNGNITVSFPNTSSKTVYKGGELPKNVSKETYSSGADGFKLLEHAYAEKLQDDIVKEAQDSLKGQRLEEFNKFVEKNRNSKDGIFVYFDEDEPYWTTFKDAVEKSLYNQGHIGKFSNSHFSSFGEYLLGNGSKASYVLGALGFENEIYANKIDPENNPGRHQMSKKLYLQPYPDIPTKELHSMEKLKKDIKAPDFFENNSVQLGMDEHAWSITSEKDSNGEIGYYIYNPHNQGIPIKFDSFENFLKYLEEKAENVTVARIK